MSKLIHELQIAVRRLIRAPGFTVTAVVTLALGIGANIAIFAVMNAVILNPSGIPRITGLVAPRARYATMGPDLANISLSGPDFADVAKGTDVFAAAAVLSRHGMTWSGEGREPEQVRTAQVSARYFDVFEVRPALGRVFTPEEDQPEAGYEAVLAHSTWVKKFSSDPAVIGRTITLDRQQFKVIGVMGDDFAWPNDAEMWTPIALKPAVYQDPDNRFNEYLTAVARLQPGKTVADANQYLARKSQEVQQSGGRGGEFARSAHWGMFVEPLNDLISGDMRTPLRTLLAAVMLVLLIACANIAGLQLARASARERETSIRVALGARTATLIWSALAESAVITGLGAILSLVFARTLAPALLSLAPPALARNIDVQFSAPVLLFAAAAILVCTVLCGLAPAWVQTRLRSFAALKESGTTGTTGTVRQRLRSAMVVCQVALAVVLLFAAGLVLRNLRELASVQVGFEAAGVATAAIDLPSQGYQKAEQQNAFFNALESQLAGQPGVHSAAIADALPFSGDGGMASFSVRGMVVPRDQPGPHGNIRLVSPQYFTTLRIPLLTGRMFSSEDRIDSPPVAIVDDVLAKRFWPNQNAVGQAIGFSNDDGKPTTWITIVGIVRHARASSLEGDTAEGFYYLPLSQSLDQGHIEGRLRHAWIATRADHGTAEAQQSAIRNAVHAVDPSLAVHDFAPLESLVADSLLGRRFAALLLSCFAALALLLSALGIYGVVEYAVRLRRRELGIRMALGAARGNVIAMILRQGVVLATAGVAAGAVAVLALGRVLSSIVYQTRLFDFGGVVLPVLLLLVTVLIASYLPARRAAQLQPAKTLRQE